MKKQFCCSIRQHKILLRQFQPINDLLFFINPEKNTYHKNVLLFMQRQEEPRDENVDKEQQQQQRQYHHLEDPVSGSSIQETNSEQLTDPWAVSRREATRAFVALVGWLCHPLISNFIICISSFWLLQPVLYCIVPNC
jgi:hypothetical protein